MSIDKFHIIITMVNFVILYFILRHFLFERVNSTINSRESEIIGRIKKAEEDEQKAELLKLENETQLKEAKTKGKTIVEDYKKKAEKVSDEVIKEANDEAQLIMERARREAEREKHKAQDEIKNQVIDLAVLMSSKALEQSIDEETHRRLIQDFITKVGI